MKYVILTLLFIFIIPQLFIPSSEERQTEKDNKYKNGPVVIATKAMCNKYEHYDNTYWSCEDKSIEYVEEQICTPQAGRADNCRMQMVRVIK